MILMRQVADGRCLLPTTPWLFALIVALLGEAFFAAFVFYDASSFDLLTIFFLRPLARIAWMMGVAAILSFFPSFQNLFFSRAIVLLFPLWWIAPLFDGLFSLWHFAPASTFFGSISDILAVFATAGVWPRPLVSRGTLFTFWAVLFVVMRWGSVVGNLSWKSIAVMILSLWTWTVFFIVFPSLLGLIGLWTSDGIWLIGPEVVHRGLILLQTQQYWWHGYYSRFPYLSGGEGEGSVKLFLGAWSWLVVVCGWILFKWREMSLPWQTWRQYISRPQLFIYLILLGFGWITALLQRGMLHFGIADFLSFLLWLGTAGCLLLIWMVEQDLSQARHGTLSADHPFNLGTISTATVVEWNRFLIPFAFFGGALLGWPLFWLISMALLLQRLKPHSFAALHSETWELAYFVLYGLVWILFGWFFGMRSADPHLFSLPLFFASTLWLFSLYFSWHQTWIVSLQNWIEQHDVLSDKLASVIRHGAQSIFFLSFFVFPSMTGWWHWWLIAFPCSIASIWIKTNLPSRRWQLVLISVYLFVGIILSSLS